MVRHFPIDSTVCAILIGSTFLVFLTLVALGLRCWGRYYNGTKLYWDDYLAILSSAQGVAILVIQGMWSTMGEGLPFAAVNRNNLVMTKMLLIVFELLYATCTATIKFSVLFFYLRIFSVQVGSTLGKLVQCALAFVTLWTVGNLLQVYLICTPFEASYDDEFVGACGNRIASYIGIGAFNVVADFAIMSLPMSVIWSLQIDRSSKIGLTVVFFLGFITTGISLVRMISLPRDLELSNLTQSMVWPVFWTTLEVHISILCINVPTLAYVLRYFTNPRGARSVASDPMPASPGPLRSVQGRRQTGMDFELDLFTPSSGSGPQRHSFPSGRPNQYGTRATCEAVSPAEPVAPEEGVQVTQDRTVQYMRAGRLAALSH
ncbi:hypothetical protein QBC37DRAFT_458669 [Rhypophila decipiens]|uniref:Rhodopsin domain-containing protein n=1 Tax=Rhypophila decipiens TaxID=261697 RepID=A0AAN7B963_9PEZI|nr:hypothetical protein QBC37DRAFT_458669 [Rhypophila decipiens]